MLWFARYPDRFRSGQNPLAAYRPRQAPTTHRGASLPKPLSGRSGPAGFSTTFCLVFRPGKAIFHPVCFSLTGVLTVAVSHTTLLSLACAGVARPHLGLTRRSRCYPCFSKRNSAPQLLVGFLWWHASSPLTGQRFAFRLSLVRLSPTSRFPSTDLQPHGSSGPSQASRLVWLHRLPLAVVCKQPCRLRATAHPDRLPSSVGNPNLLSLFGSFQVTLKPYPPYRTCPVRDRRA